MAPLTKCLMGMHQVQGWGGSNPALAKKQVTRWVGHEAIAVSCPTLFRAPSGLGLARKATAMTITERMLSDLSCMFTMYGSHPQTWGTIDPENRCNYDYLEANGRLGHSLPSLELPSIRFEELPSSYKEALKEEAYKALHKVMTPSKADIVLAAKQERDSLTLDAIDARDTSNRPDTIPADMSVMRVDYWKPAHKVFVPNKSVKPDATIKDLAADKGGFVMSLPDLPQGQILGVLSTEAWRRGEHANIAVHAPKPLPPYKAPVRELTESEQQVAAWLADPSRKVTRASKPDRLASLMAKFWEHGDGKEGIQPIDPRNKELRDMGRAA